jgi:hypothetical protein
MVCLQKRTKAKVLVQPFQGWARRGSCLESQGALVRPWAALSNRFAVKTAASYTGLCCATASRKRLQLATLAEGQSPRHQDDPFVDTFHPIGDYGRMIRSWVPTRVRSTLPQSRPDRQSPRTAGPRASSVSPWNLRQGVRANSVRRSSAPATNLTSTPNVFDAWQEQLNGCRRASGCPW